MRIRRTITWEGESTQTTVSFEEYLSLMKEYGASKSKTVRSSRMYLRSLGLVLDKEGRIIEK